MSHQPIPQLAVPLSEDELALARRALLSDSNPFAKVLKGWITIGAKEEGEGTHVFIDDSGTVTAGPAALTGHPVNNLPGSKPKPGKPKPGKPKPGKKEPKAVPEHARGTEPEPTRRTAAEAIKADLEAHGEADLEKIRAEHPGLSDEDLKAGAEEAQRGDKENVKTDGDTLTSERRDDGAEERPAGEGTDEPTAEQPAAKPGRSGPGAAEGAGGQVAGTARGAGAEGGAGAGQRGGEPAGEGTPGRVPAGVGRVNKRLDTYQKHFQKTGQHQVADWVGRVRDHVNAVGVHEALEALGPVGAEGDKTPAAYEGAWFDDDGSASMGEWAEGYLNRYGITLLPEGATPEARQKLVSSRSPTQGQTGRPTDADYLAGDYLPKDPTFKDKLEESKHLPGLESSEDLGTIVGDKVTHLTDKVVAELDKRYGKGQWIVKAYGDDAFAGHGIFFPQRAQALRQSARDTIWQSGSELTKYGFAHLRDESGKVIGIKHQGGDEYKFGSEKYANTVHGDARHWADKAHAAAENEQGAALLNRSGEADGKDFMAQPAFPVVGVSDEERAKGVTIKPGQEGRVHVVTRNGKAELVPHSTWLKEHDLPVVFESEDTKAMAQAAVDAINALPESERAGQIYAPDIVKTAEGYKVVEANPANETGSSGYLGDNPFIIDSYVSHLTGREPAHVRFLRNLLSQKVKPQPRQPGKKPAPQPASRGDNKRGGKRPKKAYFK